MNRLALLLVAALVAATGTVLALENWPMPAAPALADMVGDPKRGAYLARLSGCITCHTTPGAAPLSGGQGLVSKFGTFFAPNITVDRANGIGEWTFAQFVRAVRQGISPDGEPYYPAFPYEFYATLTDQDMADLWAAVQQTPPSDKPSREHEVGFPFNIRAGVKPWRTFFERPVQYAVDPERTSEWNRGRYLVWGPAHCAACHAPRNMIGGLPDNMELGGDPQMQDGGRSPSLTAKDLTARGYTKGRLLEALRTGITPDGDVFGGSMAEVVHGSTKFLLDQHLEDISTYLLDLGRQ
ncbi:c-type cytochrome [Devosia rhizoryzae]|uniref:Cytochrome c n=1 Tax=Devosia rhizoryzae TaxID=2774137 RepID=A0ABX7C8E9_9HYPH|nr:cytochrome c [Devosia rhizoryzae]QQR40078.1 cytochrome c [Devosia rhizoryzae]